MNEKVVRLIPSASFDFNAMYDSLKGQSFDQVLVITSDLGWYGNVDVGDALLLMGRLRLKLEKEAGE